MPLVFRCVLASLLEGLSVRRFVRPPVTSYFENLKMKLFMYVISTGVGQWLVLGLQWSSSVQQSFAAQQK